MSIFSTPVLAKFAKVLLSKITKELAKAGIKSTVRDYSLWFVGIDNAMLCINEGVSGSGFSRQSSGKLEVLVHRYYLNNGPYGLRRIRYDVDDKTVSKVVAKLVERFKLIVEDEAAYKEVQAVKDNNREARRRLLKKYPEYEEAIDHNELGLSLSFGELTEVQAAAILKTAQEVGSS